MLSTAVFEAAVASTRSPRAAACLRYTRDAGEMQARYKGEIQARYRRDTGEMQARYRGIQWRCQRLLDQLDHRGLPPISHVSPLYLPYISPCLPYISPYLPYISRLLDQLDHRGGLARARGSVDQAHGRGGQASRHCLQLAGVEPAVEHLVRVRVRVRIRVRVRVRP